MNEKLLPKVSVVIPCYNHGIFLNDSVNSVLEQTFQDFEIIIVNDGSTDDYTNKVINSYTNNKIKIITTTNQGLSAARNNGIKISTGEYILTLDSDDIFESTFLEKAIPILNDNTNIGVVTCWYKTFGKDFGREYGVIYPEGGDIKNFLARNNCCASSLFKKECWVKVGGYNEKFLNGYEDWSFWIDVTKKGWVVNVIQEVLFNYRVTNNGLYSVIVNKKPELLKQLVNEHKEIFIEYIDLVLYEKEIEIKSLLNSKTYKLGNFIAKIIKKLTFR